MKETNHFSQNDYYIYALLLLLILIDDGQRLDQFKVID